jgi:hypothetical protein
VLTNGSTDRYLGNGEEEREILGCGGGGEDKGGCLLGCAM